MEETRNEVLEAMANEDTDLQVTSLEPMPEKTDALVTPTGVFLLGAGLGASAIGGTIWAVKKIGKAIEDHKAKKAEKKQEAEVEIIRADEVPEDAVEVENFADEESKEKKPNKKK